MQHPATINLSRPLIEQQPHPVAHAQSSKVPKVLRPHNNVATDPGHVECLKRLPGNTCQWWNCHFPNTRSPVWANIRAKPASADNTLDTVIHTSALHLSATIPLKTLVKPWDPSWSTVKAGIQLQPRSHKKKQRIIIGLSETAMGDPQSYPPPSPPSSKTPPITAAKHIMNGSQAKGLPRAGSEPIDPTALTKALRNFTDVGQSRERSLGASPSRKRQRVYGDRFVTVLLHLKRKALSNNHI